jgi:alkaline phosphatase
MLNRRSFFTRASLATAALGAPHIARSAADLASQPGAKPRKIIHLVADGMSHGTLTCSDLFSQKLRRRGLTWLALLSNPATHTGLMNTRSLNSLVTDSAAASSAWGSGSRVPNGALNVLPDGRLLTPLYQLFAQAGWARGLVTTAEITHATPAGFAAATRSRDNAQLIASQYLEQKIDVLLGGGRPFFDGARRKDKRNLREEARTAGYAVVKDRTELLAAPVDQPLLGTFADSHLPYTLDQLADAKLTASVPTLAEMTSAALARLGRQERFILQVEGARVDHAAHNSDAAAAFRDQIALDEALDLCLAYQKQNPETLIVVTTDHANSNPGVNGMGGGYRLSPQRFAALGEVRMSYPEILKRLQKLGTKIKVAQLSTDREDRLDVPDPMAKVVPPGDAKPAEGEETKVNSGEATASAYFVEPRTIIDFMADATGYRMSERRARLFHRVLAGDYQALYDQMNSTITQLGQLMANRLGIGWTGNTHTSDYVPLLAIGPGAELFTGMLQNTDVFRHYTALAGIDFQNPTLPLIADADVQDVERAGRYALA